MPKKPPNRKGQVWEFDFQGKRDVATIVREPQYIEEQGAWYHIADLKVHTRAGLPEASPWEQDPTMKRLA